MTLPGLIDAMEDAATVDLRADKVLPLALRVIGRPRDAALAHAVSELRAWRRDGSHRIDRDRDGVYEHAEAIRLMDAWWPRWLRAEFAPLMGGRLFGKLRSVIGLDNAPNRSRPGLAHVGSAYEDGWYGYASKDLRTLVGEKVRGRYGRVFCGRGSRARCRGALESSLRQALAVPAAALYRDEACARQGRQGDQACFDAIEFQPVGALTEPLIPWQNRPTYQQAVEVERRVPG